MPLASGLGSQMGFKKETTYGTAVVVDKFFEFDSESLVLDQTYQDGLGLRAGRTIMPSGRMRQTIRQAGGATPMDVPTKGFGSLLDLMHGLVPTVVQQGVTTAWLQTHLIGTSQPNKSATLQFNKPTSAAVDDAFTYPGSILTGVTFSIDVAGILKTTLTWDSQDETTPTTTPAGAALAAASYLSGVTSFIGTKTGVSLTMGGVAVAVAKAVTLNWVQPYKEDRFYLGAVGTKAKPIPNGLATLGGTVDVEWAAETYYQQFRAGTPIGLVLTLQNDLIASTFFEKIIFTMTAIQPRGTSPTVSGPDVLDQSIPFVVGDDGTNPPLKIEYQSTDVAV